MAIVAYPMHCFLLSSPCSLSHLYLPRCCMLLYASLCLSFLASLPSCVSLVPTCLALKSQRRGRGLLRLRLCALTHFPRIAIMQANTFQSLTSVLSTLLASASLQRYFPNGTGSRGEGGGESFHSIWSFMRLLQPSQTNTRRRSEKEGRVRERREKDEKEEGGERKKARKGLN